jgi:hypothetical protein
MIETLTALALIATFVGGFMLGRISSGAVGAKQ